MSEKPKDLEVLWDTEQLAQYLHVSIRTVYAWMRTGKVIDPTKIIKIGNRIRIPRSEVMRIATQARKKFAKPL